MVYVKIYDSEMQLCGVAAFEQSDIKALIPEGTTVLNPLVNMSFVTTAIATSTATFRGTYETLAELQAVTDADDNDYGYVEDVDEYGNMFYKRYKFNREEWEYEFSLSNTQFNQSQWGAINSGVTSDDITKLSTLPTSSELTVLLNDKQDAIGDLQTIRNQAANAAPQDTTYTKTEVNNLITTPNQEYVSVIATSQTTSVTDVLPATGAADTTYRVGNWDGTQYNDSVFSEYAWNGSAYIKLSTKSQIGEVYDISANHADTKYADLTAALGTNGANIPDTLRKGGMSVKFVQSSDNKYVQYRLMANSFTTDVTQWQGVDDEPIAGSDNMVKSGGVEKYLSKNKTDVDNPEGTLGYILINGEIVASDSYTIVRPILLKSGETILLNKGENVYLGRGIAVVFKTDSNGNWQETLITRANYPVTTTKVSFTNTTNADIYVGTCTYNNQRSYTIQTLAEAASKQSIADLLAIHGNPLNQEDALSVLGRISAASVFNYGYATIANGADVAAKTVVKPGFQLTTNMAFVVRCCIKNTADNVTLNINNTGAKNLYYNGYRVSSTNTWEADTYALLWYNDTHYNMYGLDFNIIKNLFAAYGVTNNNDVNLMVRELYLTGLNPNNKYYISVIRKDTTQSRWGLYINPEDSYGVDYSVAGFFASEKPNGFIKLDAVNGSGISGYAIVDWSKVPDGGYTMYYDNAQIYNEKVSDINFNPSILANLTSSALDNIEEEIGNVRELAEKNTGSDWQNVYDLANNIKEDRPYFLNSDYSAESSYDDSSYLDAKIRNIPAGKHFLFVTDTHIGYDRGMQLKETEIMAYVKAKLNAGCVVFGGDAVGQQDTPYKAAKELAVYAEDKFNAFGPDFLWCQGNHDANANTNSANRISSSEICKRTTGIMDRYGKAVFDTEGIELINNLSATDDEKAQMIAWWKLHYYYDDNERKIRFIVIETGDGSNGLGTLCGGAAWNGYLALNAYTTFIGNAMLSCPDGWDVVIVMHQMTSPTSISDEAVASFLLRSYYDFYAMLSAFKNHGSVTIVRVGDGEYGDKPYLKSIVETRIPSTGAAFDFSNRTSGRVFCISGHFHMDDAWVIQNPNTASVWNYRGKEYGAWDDVLANAILHIQVDRATINDQGPMAGSAKAPNAFSYPNNTAETRIGTKNEVLFDVVTITPDNKVVCTRIGAGSDREYNIPMVSA